MGLVSETARRRDRGRRLPCDQHPSRPADSQIDLLVDRAEHGHLDSEPVTVDERPAVSYTHLTLPTN